jgi:hypothetical protein
MYVSSYHVNAKTKRFVLSSESSAWKGVTCKQIRICWRNVISTQIRTETVGDECNYNRTQRTRRVLNIQRNTYQSVMWQHIHELSRDIPFEFGVPQSSLKVITGI